MNKIGYPPKKSSEALFFEISQKIIYHCKTCKVQILKIATDWAVFVLVGTCKPLKTERTVFVEINYKPSRYRGHPKKLHCYTAVNRLKKGVRLFRYSCWSPRKSILKLDDKKYLTCCHAPGSHGKNVSSPIPFFALRSEEYSDQFHQIATKQLTLLIR